MNRSNIENNDPLWYAIEDFMTSDQIGKGAAISTSSPDIHDDPKAQESTNSESSGSVKSIDASGHTATRQVAIETEPHDADLWNRKGINHAKAGQLKEAYECFEKALIVNPNHQGAWINKGNVFLKLQGKEREALACFDRAIDLEPNDAEAWFVKGVALARLEQMEDALASYEHATELEPRHARAWYGMGLAARYLGYKKRAEECFKKSKNIERK